jgi:hypothetical protein
MRLETDVLVSLQPHLMSTRIYSLHFCEVGDDLNHVGFVIDMRLDAVA